MYSRIADMDQGWVAYGSTLLVRRTMEMDSKGTLLCTEVNQSTLKVCTITCLCHSNCLTVAYYKWKNGLSLI